MDKFNWKQIGTLIATGAIGGVVTLSGLVVAQNQGWVKLNPNSVANTSTDIGQPGGTVLNDGELSVEAVAKKVVPSVVSITGVDNVKTFFGTTQQTTGGTGFIVKSDGLIVTNKHVVSSTTAKYTVQLSTGRKYDATVTARDPSADLALVKISATNLPVVEFGDSSKVVLGQKVVVIGNALGQYQNSVTTGIISGLNRSVTASNGMGSSEQLTNLIQTDAAINPGDSGGPLVNLFGQVVGINTAVDTQAQGVGFAIPINSVRGQIQTVSSGGEIARPKLGVRYISITPQVAATNDMSITEGALVTRGQKITDVAVQSGSPADLAGIREGDVLVSIDGTKITEANNLGSILLNYNPNDTISIQLIRQGVTKTVKVRLGKI